MASISHSRIVVQVAIACFLSPATDAINCWVDRKIEACPSTVDTCFFKNFDEIGGYRDITFKGCYEEGLTLPFSFGNVRNVTPLLRK